MDSKRQHALLVLMLVCAGRTHGMVFEIALGVAAIAGGWYSYSEMLCLLNLNECCKNAWISFDGRGLKTDMERQLIGQHIASSVILDAVTGFLNNDNPQKPLVLSFHGTPGTGKNFASQLIAKNIYKKQIESRFVHLFNSMVHFPDRTQVETYKHQLYHWIKGNVTNCAHSIFIFDEMDKMHPHIIDSIKPFVDYYPKLDGVSYRKAIFIFLSNAGGEIITQTTLDFWRSGKSREELQLKDVESALSTSVFNNKNNGLWHATLIENHLVDYFIPFLPLERRHVVLCVLAAMEAKGVTPDTGRANRIADDLIYSPKEEKLFSVAGCKTIASRMNWFD